MALYRPQGVEPERFGQFGHLALLLIQVVIRLRVSGMILHGHEHANLHRLPLFYYLRVPVLSAARHHFPGKQLH